MTQGKDTKKKARARASDKRTQVEPAPPKPNVAPSQDRPRPRARRAAVSDPPPNYAKTGPKNEARTPPPEPVLAPDPSPVSARRGQTPPAPRPDGSRPMLGAHPASPPPPPTASLAPLHDEVIPKAPGLPVDFASSSLFADMLRDSTSADDLPEVESSIAPPAFPPRSVPPAAEPPAYVTEPPAYVTEPPGAFDREPHLTSPSPPPVEVEIARRTPAPGLGLLADPPPRAVPGGRPAVTPRASMMAPPPDDDSGAILVTGICGRLGKLVVREVHRDHRVIGIDRRGFPDIPKDVTHHRFDLRRKKTRDVFRSGRVRAVVHLGVMHDPRSNYKDRHSWNVVAFQKLLEYMAQYRVRKLVVLSSANVYGPQPDNPQFLSEDAPLLGSQEFYAIRDLVELDMLAQGNFWKNSDVETVILRPCHILGEVRNAPSNYLRLENPVTIMGFDPMVQLIHERDVVRAIQLALEPGVRGIFNIRGPGELPLSRVLAMAGRKPVAVAAPLAKLAIEQFFRFRMGSFPAPEIDHIRYVCMVDDSRAREVLGWAPRYSLSEAIDAAISAA